MWFNVSLQLSFKSYCLTVAFFVQFEQWPPFALRTIIFHVWPFSAKPSLYHLRCLPRLLLASSSRGCHSVALLVHLLFSRRAMWSVHLLIPYSYLFISYSIPSCEAKHLPPSPPEPLAVSLLVLQSEPRFESHTTLRTGFTSRTVFFWCLAEYFLIVDNFLISKRLSINFEFFGLLLWFFCCERPFFV